MTHEQLDQAVEDLAHLYGYVMLHIRPAMSRDGTWHTPVAADGVGFPDYILAKPGMPLIIAEGKTEGEHLTKGHWVGTGRKAHYVMGQEDWFVILSQILTIRVGVWYPHDVPLRVEKVLKGEGEKQ